MSAFTRINLLNHLNQLFSSIIISIEIFEEYSIKWRKALPNWIKILESDKSIILKEIPLSLSQADLSIIRLAIEHELPIASDDRPLRDYADKVGVKIIGSLGLLKTLNKRKIIKTRKEYMDFLNALQEDVYMSEDLIKWALED